VSNAKEKTKPCFAITKNTDKPCRILKVTYSNIYKQNYCNKCRFYKTKKEFKKGIEKGKEI
jgi:hypothetical protein